MIKLFWKTCWNALALFFLIGTVSASASSSCGSWYGGCKMGVNGLTGLFRSNQSSLLVKPEETGSAGRPFFLPYTPVSPNVHSNVPITDPDPVNAPKPKTKKVSLPKKPQNMAPHPLPVYQGDTQLLVMRSENRQLSANGHDTQAILMMRCRSGELNVLLDFPGYPMSDAAEGKTVSYKLDNRRTKQVGFSTSDQLSVIGVWQHAQARKLAKEMLRSRAINLQTKDSENTNISARFNVQKIRRAVGNFNRKCGIV